MPPIFLIAGRRQWTVTSSPAVLHLGSKARKSCLGNHCAPRASAVRGGQYSAWGYLAFGLCCQCVVAAGRLKQTCAQIARSFRYGGGNLDHLRVEVTLNRERKLSQQGRRCHRQKWPWHRLNHNGHRSLA